MSACICLCYCVLLKECDREGQRERNLRREKKAKLSDTRPLDFRRMEEWRKERRKRVEYRYSDK